MADPATPDAQFQEQRFTLLINAVADYAIYMLDASGHIATWNPGARRYKGYEADEIIGQHFSRFFTDEDREAGLPERVLRTAAEEGRFEAEGWRVRKDGVRFWAHVVVDPVIAPDGTVIGYAKVTRDVTEKRKRDQALFESEQRFRLLVQGVRDYAIYMLDQDGRITNWNSGAEAIKGYSAEEIVGEHFSRFYTDDDRANGEPARALATALREGKYEKEAWRRRKDGSLFWASVVLDPIFDETGEHVGFAKITRDISEKKRAEEELEEARNALFQSQKLQALGELTGGIAHDFNNLMTVIRGSAELLLRPGLQPERQQRYLDAIIETADRAAKLTDHLLAFGRRQPLKPEVIDLNVRIDALAEVLSRTLGNNVEVVLDLASGLWQAEVDPAQLENAILNAAINARDAMPEGGKLTITTRNVKDKAGDLVCIALADTGTGMPEEVVARAFEPFFTTKPVGKGTGLGLSQIHGFAAQTGGRAEIQSKSGEGTIIHLLLPRSKKQPQEAADPAQGAELPPGLRVLLVEDNEQVRIFAEHLLEDLKCHVISVEGGERALERLEQEAVDLLFSDVVMPGMSGVELARRVREAYPELPILLASGYSDEIIEGAGAEFHAIRKPYGAEMLTAHLHAALASKRQATERRKAASV